MKIWRCRKTRRRIPDWINGACSPSEAAAVTAHVASCAACAAEAALAVTLSRASGGGAGAPSGRQRGATWVRLERAMEASPRVAREAWVSGRRFRGGIAAAALALGLLLGGHWWSQRSGQERDPTPHFNWSLWQAQSPSDDPMGSTTDRLLEFLGGKS
jgi:anti-sigma factor RsiW